MLSHGHAAPRMSRAATPGGPYYYASPAGARLFIVELVGGGGAGGGAVATGVGERSGGGGGGGGGYVLAHLSRAQLEAMTTLVGGSAVVPYLVGAGGTGVAGAIGNVGARSAFGYVNGTDYVLEAGGGYGGWASGVATLPAYADFGDGGIAGSTIVGPVGVRGDDGSPCIMAGSAHHGSLGIGGGSHFAGRRSPGIWNNAGQTGHAYGGGGSGAANRDSQPARAGGAGAGGLVIVTAVF